MAEIEGLVDQCDVHCSATLQWPDGIQKSVYLQTWRKKVVYKFWKTLETCVWREIVMTWTLSYYRIIHGKSWREPTFELPFCRLTISRHHRRCPSSFAEGHASENRCKWRPKRTS